jgi:hypothetical protein
MGLINANPLLGIVKSYRLVWIGGRFGGHKTSLAYKLSQPFLDDGYRLISNNRSVWADDLEQVQIIGEGAESLLKSVVILDEGGLFFKSTRQIEMIASFARKMDVIYLIPSFWPPTRSAQVLTIQPIFNFKSAGLPLIAYKWRVKLGAFSDSGYFFWWRPNEIYGIYDTKDPGDYAGQIVEYLIEKTEDWKRIQGRYNRDDQISNLEVSEEELFADSVQGLAEAVDSFTSIPIKNSRRRRV